MFCLGEPQLPGVTAVDVGTAKKAVRALTETAPSSCLASLGLGGSTHPDRTRYLSLGEFLEQRLFASD